jgi:hypothetical protein
MLPLKRRATGKEYRMKVAILSLLTLFMGASAAMANQVDRTVEVSAGARSATAEAQDGEVIRLLFPFVEKAEPRAEIREESLVYDDRCEILSVKNEAPQVEVLLRMPSTIADSGFNGCRVAIDRGFASDDSDTLHFEYGYSILD